MGETSTRSRPNSAAVSIACLVGITPICSPSGSITLTSLALMSLLMFVLSDRIGRLGRLGAAMFYLLALIFVVYICAHAQILRGLAGFFIWCTNNRPNALPGPIPILRYIHPVEYITKLRNASKIFLNWTLKKKFMHSPSICR